MKLEVFMSYLNKGQIIEASEIVIAPMIVTEKTILDYIRNKITSVEFVRFISLSWRPAA